MNELALFAGACGVLGGVRLGWRTVCAVEHDPYAASVLVARQNDGYLPPFPVWLDDIRKFDGRPLRGHVDVVSGGFPCTDISVAGKGAGIDGEESGLWREQLRIVCECGAWLVWMENSPALTVRGLGTILHDLAALGFNAEWGVLGARDAGAEHKRDRIWILAYSDMLRCEAAQRRGVVHDQERHRPREIEGWTEQQPWAGWSSWRDTEPVVDRMADGDAADVDRIRCLGNAQVPQVAELAFKVLMGRASKEAK